jgi:poly-beta-1,6-N-acetyl-D-glucosamine synthase
MLLYLIIIFSLYFIFLLLCLFGWSKVAHHIATPKANSHGSVSVIVPVRNEAKNLVALLNSLLTQNVDGLYWEVIFVDDHSVDNSMAIISDWKKSNPQVNSTVLSANGVGKKNAITEAVQAARGDIIMTTDADCDLPSNWISVMYNSFDVNSVMVVGAVKINPKNEIFSRMQSMEFSSLLGSGLAMLKVGFPVFCNGASLAYRKSAFREVGGYVDNAHIASGDDEFLMRKLNRRFGDSITIVKDFSATVSTNPQSTVKDFFHQRIRWAGKWKANESWGVKLLALFILVFQISFITGVYYIFTHESNQEVIVLCLLKITLEGLFLFRVCKQIGQSFSFGSFLLLQILYPCYVIFIGVISQFTRALWKDRRIE